MSSNSSGSVQPATLLSLFVYNPTLGSEDTESRKLLYFYPPSTSMNAQKDIVGIMEGLSSFSRELSGPQPLESVRSDQQLYGLLECEPDWWLAVSIRHPAVVSSASAKGKTGEKKLEFLVDDVDDAAVQSLLRSCYCSFRLFNGSLAAAAAAAPLDVLRARLELFFRFYLPTVRFASLSSFSLPGFQFLFVDKACFLSIQYLLNLVRCSLPSVVHSCCLYDGKLIYTSIAGDDMLALYQLHEPQRMTAFTSYLAINEELTMRVEEAAAAPAGGSTSGNSNTTGEGGDDVFAIPQSLYEAMAVRNYSGEGASESKRADFLSDLSSDGSRKGDKGKDGGKSKQRRKDNTAATADKGGGVEAAGGAAAGGKSSGPPVGFLTGPYRSPLPASVLPSSSGAWSQLNSPMWTQPLPITLADRACVNSPRVFLSQQPEHRGAQGDDRKDAAAAAAPAAEGAGGPSSPASRPLHRLVMYQRESISLCFIVASDASQSTNNAPPLSFYDQLESLLHARNTIKKLAAVLAASAASVAAASASSPSSQPAPAAQQPLQQVLSSPSLSSPAASSSSAEPYRFLYYNAMNLAVKCTFDPSSVMADALRVMRDMHNSWSRKGGRAVSDGSCESVVRLRAAGWVVGRKALQSHREFFLLLDDKTAPTLAEVQREMQQLVHSYLSNAFIGA